MWGFSLFICRFSHVRSHVFLLGFFLFWCEIGSHVYIHLATLAANANVSFSVGKSLYICYFSETQSNIFDYISQYVSGHLFDSYRQTGFEPDVLQLCNIWYLCVVSVCEGSSTSTPVKPTVISHRCLYVFNLAMILFWCFLPLSGTWLVLQNKNDVLMTSFESCSVSIMIVIICSRSNRSCTSSDVILEEGRGERGGARGSTREMLHSNSC